MNRKICCKFIYLSVIICIAISAFAANKPKPSSSEIDMVERVLALSATASFDRRDALKPESRPVSDPDSVWWQAGFIHSGGHWLPYEKSVAAG